MPRILIATVAGLLFVALYVMAVVALADRLGPMHWAVQFGYFLIVGSLWVLPVRWLMLWSAHRR